VSGTLSTVTVGIMEAATPYASLDDGPAVPAMPACLEGWRIPTSTRVALLFSGRQSGEIVNIRLRRS
jgi:hypothetical protein